MKQETCKEPTIWKSIVSVHPSGKQARVRAGIVVVQDDTRFTVNFTEFVNNFRQRNGRILFTIHGTIILQSNSSYASIFIEKRSSFTGAPFCGGRATITKFVTKIDTTALEFCKPVINNDLAVQKESEAERGSDITTESVGDGLQGQRSYKFFINLNKLSYGINISFANRSRRLTFTLIVKENSTNLCITGRISGPDEEGGAGRASEGEPAGGRRATGCGATWPARDGCGTGAAAAAPRRAPATHG
ncbi:hypothetical protein EVAR_29416_1 [Eumeta japonica]|uniref:Uncharacterized protein n=1 Tax=Eumeta variegata TaxID=151549 RepID=A0A4C1VTM5_EUMVA|nr:hypothetical protein EVAR_29416_1 [Eumeta japonica]